MRPRHILLITATLLWSVIAGAGPASAGTGYIQSNLVSDLPGVATFLDPNLKNPWGMASTPTSPIWVADNHTGVATLYNGSGVAQALVVTIPPPAGGTGPSAPTGNVFNASTTDFTVAGAGTAAHFIFATEDGTIAAWNSGTSAVLKVDNSASGAVYKGLAIGNNGVGNFLYATNFSAGTIDVFNGSFSTTTLAGNFTDPNLPAGFAPFGIQNIGGILFVTYAKQDAAKHDDVAGPGNGYVNRFDTNGNLLSRFASGGALNSPWGLATAGANFGDLSGLILIGNFGDGKINGFHAATGTFVNTLNNPAGNPIAIPGLWALLFGNGGTGGLTSELFFSAGIPGPDEVEDHGLFGKFAAVPGPPPGIPALQLPLAVLLALFLAAAGMAMLNRRRSRRLPTAD